MMHLRESAARACGGVRGRGLRRILWVPVAVLACAAGTGSSLPAENWPQWRGPANNGVSGETNIAATWSATENVAWRLELPRPAGRDPVPPGATPVIWEDRIFLTTVDRDDLLLMCISTGGQELWRQTVGRGNQTARADEGTSASPSPVTDGRHVWCFMGTGDLACYTVDGAEVWKVNLQDRYGEFDIQFGMTSSPVLHEGRLYLQLIHGDGNPRTQEAVVVALDGLTGSEIWKQIRRSDAHTENEHSYASPIMYDDGERQFLITHGADYAIGHRLSDGGEIWRLGGLNPKGPNYNPFLRFVASPAAAPGLVVVPTAKRGVVVGLSPGATGGVALDDEAVLWQYSPTPDVPSPLIHDGLVYLCLEDGVMHCLDAATGEPHYANERTHGGRYRASPVYADGKVYITARDGVVTVIKAGPRFEILAQNETGEQTAASPVISNGTLYLRTFDALWAIREEK